MAIRLAFANILLQGCQRRFIITFPAGPERCRQPDDMHFWKIPMLFCSLSSGQEETSAGADFVTLF
ncbi:hypothetical protein [Pantoea piersonii]|uniref:hypothetical protein n=1 Tax=Pantoea piersonii TaxID=2364647 RepID=UPI001832100B|nr:hypothetical protein [Pantoea piersonii]MBZ6386355.1 hypothetical protein [Pantoea piersonii]MBZ6400671.1 hypothetical protein [Pantoea piersonii]MBZ6409222.1 hypothetical protein [Pantoea piersonii]MBZ6425849.1 hypothetical protein [Pantoea piersonii]NYB34910.1 hypothetical protein [Pantoea piersonii]